MDKADRVVLRRAVAAARRIANARGVAAGQQTDVLLASWLRRLAAVRGCAVVPAGRSDATMAEALAPILDDPALASTWADDETLGWVFEACGDRQERQRMRRASAAPRDRHEVALRNRFFTPRWVVEFLTDNALGRLWWEMRAGDTPLAVGCPYLVQRGARMPRALRDPRTISVLDPACGAMHFGLYAFDVLERIYAESWQLARGGGAACREPGFAPFADFASGFGDAAAFAREVPRLILRHNLRGFDIDARAAAVARDALWLRAQASWQRLGLAADERPMLVPDDVSALAPGDADPPACRDVGMLLRDPSTCGAASPVGALCRHHHDVVLMNPPFGEYPADVRELLADAYPNTSNDLLAMFIERALELAPDGYTGCITSRTWMFLVTFAGLRERVLAPLRSPFLVADLGRDVMDGAVVEAAASVLGRNAHADTLFVDALRDDGKAARLLAVADAARRGESAPGAVTHPLTAFAAIEHTPFCHWIDDALLAAMATMPRLESATRHVRVGLQTGDDARHVRAWWEVPRGDGDGARAPGWVPHSKAGESRPFAADVFLVVDWRDDGREIRGDARAVVRNESFHFRPGLTSGYRCSRYEPALVPPGAITGVAGSALHVDDPDDLWWLLALLNSEVVDALIKLRLGSSHAGIVQVGHLQRTPVPVPTEAQRRRLAALGRRGWQAQMRRLQRDETSVWFAGLPRAAITTPADGDGAEIAAVLAEIDEVAAEVYGTAAMPRAAREIAPAPRAEADDRLSWCVGVAFGRWRIDSAWANGAEPPLPEPLAEIPSAPPAMQRSGRGGAPEPASTSQCEPILVVAPGHPLDLVARVRRIAAQAFGADPGFDVGDGLEYRLRDPDGFFAAHLAHYTRGRRCAPIHWQLASTSGAATLWLHYPRLGPDAIESALGVARDLRARAAAEPATRHTVAEIDVFVRELQRHTAWRPSFTDGVPLDAAPLRGIVRHRRWRRVLDDAWLRMGSGACDWSAAARRRPAGTRDAAAPASEHDEAEHER